MNLNTIGMAKGNSLSNLLSARRKSVKFQSSTQFYTVCTTLNSTVHTGYIGATNFYYHIRCLFEHQHIVHNIHLLGQSDNYALLVLIELNLSTTNELGNRLHLAL